MAGYIVKDVYTTTSAATAAGVVTCASVTGLFIGAKGWLNFAGQPAMHVVIVDKNVTANTISVRQIFDDSYIPGNSAPRYGTSDVSAYNGAGTFNQEAGLYYAKDLSTPV